MFFDSSALFAGIVSAMGAARALLIMAEAGTLAITVSEQVIVETERALARKAPLALDDLRAGLRHARVRIVRDPAPAQVAARADVIAHAADVPIVVAAMQAQVDDLVTLSRRHFIDDPGVAALQLACYGGRHTHACNLESTTNPFDVAGGHRVILPAARGRHAQPAPG